VNDASGNGAAATGRGPFSMVQRVRFGDLDAMQHMNNVEFLRFFETARIAWIESITPAHDPTRPEAFGFIFAECHIRYRSPAHYKEDIRTWIRPAELKRSSLRMDFEMRAEGDDRLVADGWGVLVGYDYAAGRAQPIPDAFRQRVEPLLPR
jgi:acyl-CoA thioester hydrolase